MQEQYLSLPSQLLISLIQPISSSLNREEEIGSFLLDSRSLTTTQGVAFVAICTHSGDGHNYLDELYGRGIRHFIVEQDIKPLAHRMPEANWYQVTSSLQALQAVASAHRKAFRIPVVGITGSNGKTIVKEMIAQLVGSEFRLCRSPRSYNSQIGVPLSVLMLSERSQLGIFEAGISAPEEMESLETIIQPTIGIFTGIGQAHQEHFSSMTEKLREKVKLFRSVSQLICSQQDALLLSSHQLLCPRTKLYSWSSTDPEVFLYIQQQSLNKKSGHTLLQFLVNKTPYELSLPFVDRAYVEDALLSIIFCALHCPKVLEDKDKFLTLHPLPMRLEVKQSYQGNVLIDDTYSLDMTSLQIALDFQRRRSREAKMPSVVVLSDFQQTDKSPQTLFSWVRRQLESFGVKHFVGVGTDMVAHQEVFTAIRQRSKLCSYAFFPTVEALVESGYLMQFHRSTILLKGSRAFAFERLSHQLLLCQHQTILEVNLSALRKNLSYYRSLLPPNHKLICMVKADGYGLGAVELARTLSSLRVDYLAVATIEEGKALREAGIQNAIMVMNPQQGNLDALFEYELEPEVYSWSLLRSLEEEALRRHRTNYPIHLKLDTGMHRLGFLPEEVDDLGMAIQELRGISVSSIFSHLATADAPEQDDLTRAQLSLFHKMTERLKAYLPTTPLLHILNTAGIEAFATEAAYDMVRLGIGLYGFSPHQRKSVEPILKLQTSILQIKSIPKGDRIGYGGRAIAQQGCRIGILPIGYADGLSRHLGNGKCSFRVAGKLVPTIGNICMDSCMIDLTAVPEAEEGMRVHIIDEELTVERIAELMGTINYEVITSLGSRLQRIYYNE